MPAARVDVLSLLVRWDQLQWEHCGADLFGSDIIALKIEQEADAFLRAELARAAPTNRRRIIEKFVLAALGSIPWVGAFLSAVAAYFEQLGATIDDRIQSEEYLSLVRRAFRLWDEASTEEKRRYVGPSS